MKEFETITEIRKLAEKTAPGELVRLGIGDDCCLFAPREGEELSLSTDTVVEDIHFRLRYFSCYQVGVKAMAAALSDLAAMAASPVGALAAVSVDPDKAEGLLGDLARGMIDTAERHGCSLVGGDLTASPGPLVITVTVVGRVRKDMAVLRSGARPGDRIWVTGAPGNAAAALAWYEEEGARGRHHLPSPAPELRKQLLEPVPRIAEALLLNGPGPRPTAMIDISDGVASDLGHIIDSSGTGARLILENFPLDEFPRSAARVLCQAEEYFFLYGGEDYELLFTAPSSAGFEKKARSIEEKTSLRFTPVGNITDTSGRIELLGADGEIRTISKSGFDHLSKPTSFSKKGPP